MKNVLRFIKYIFMAITITILSPILIWVEYVRFGDVSGLLDYGRLGSFGNNIRIETKTDNVLWQGKDYAVPKAILSMNVYSYWTEDNVVVIKVYRNDKKIAKLKKELSSDQNKGENK